jgi:hypothetical protein
VAFWVLTWAVGVGAAWSSGLGLLAWALGGSCHAGRMAVADGCVPHTGQDVLHLVNMAYKPKQAAPGLHGSGLTCILLGAATAHVPVFESLTLLWWLL